MLITKRKLIEVALPLEAINSAAAHEKQPGIGAHPRGLHLYWARRPLAAARAVIFAQMVDDPSSCPDLFPTAKSQEKERQRLFRIIEDLVQWENSTNQKVLQQARDEIWNSWRRACAANADHPNAKELFARGRLPQFHDPFAGGGALPIEAQRLGLEAFASDLNPVAVLINKAMIEIPPKFSGRAPVNPTVRGSKELFEREWAGASGLAEDVRAYGEWMREQAQERIGHLYPPIRISPDMAKVRPDLKPLVNQELPVLAWIWARTVRSPNPAFAKVEVPLCSTFMLATKAGKETYIDPVIAADGYKVFVKLGKPKKLDSAAQGTTAGKWQAFRCLMSNEPITYDYIRAEGTAGRLGTRLMAIVADGPKGRVYLSPTPEMEVAAHAAKPSWAPDLDINYHPRDIKTQIYGLTKYGALFTQRQLAAMCTFSDLAQEVRERVRKDAASAGVKDDGEGLDAGGTGASAYADAIAVYLAFAIDRLADYNSSLATWKPSGEQVMQTYKRQALPMTWDFPESNVLGESAICWKNCVKYTAANLESAGRVLGAPGWASQCNASVQTLSRGRVVSTDPPYYDNIGYADLSDFFYVWLRRSLKPVFKDLFAPLAVPKAEELVATPYRHGSKEKAEAFFLAGMTEAMHRLAAEAHPAFPVTIYYAFKQSETEDKKGTTRTGWETFLEAVIRAGFAISGTWPMRTEMSNKVIGGRANVLASSIVLVCRKREVTAAPATRREFLAALKEELPNALSHLQRSNIAPVDLAQAAIGPGMAVYTRFASVLDADGKPIGVKEALAIINRTLDEVLVEQEGDFDADTRWSLAWFEQYGFTAGEYGVAETLSTAKNTSVEDGLVKAGIVESKRGKVRLLKAEELPKGWDPAIDTRLTAWEVVHHLVRVLSDGGEPAAAELVKKLGANAEPARELAYRLFSLCERKKRAGEALSYNGLVQSWPEITRLAREGGAPKATQTALFEEAEE